MSITLCVSFYLSDDHTSSIVYDCNVRRTYWFARSRPQHDHSGTVNLSTIAHQMLMCTLPMTVMILDAPEKCWCIPFFDLWNMWPKVQSASLIHPCRIWQKAYIFTVVDWKMFPLWYNTTTINTVSTFLVWMLTGTLHWTWQMIYLLGIPALRQNVQPTQSCNQAGYHHDYFLRRKVHPHGHWGGDPVVHNPYYPIYYYDTIQYYLRPVSNVHPG